MACHRPRRGAILQALALLALLAPSAHAGSSRGNRQVDPPARRARRTWEHAATGLLARIADGTPASFPASASGHGLIPPAKLASLREWLARDGRTFERLESIDVQEMHGRPAIVIRYRVAGDRQTHLWVTYREEFKHWNKHLRGGLRAPAGRLRMRATDLPAVEVPRRRADRDPTTPLGTLAFNSFNVGRTLPEYRAEMPRLTGVLRRLRGPGRRWMDMGAGSAAAQGTFLAGLRRAGVADADVPELLALGYRAPGGATRMRERERASGGKFRYQEGLLGPAAIRRLPRADLITDLMGVFTYIRSSREKLLDAYLDRTEVGGSVLISSYAGSFDALAGWLRLRRDRGEIEFELHNQGSSLSIRKLRD